MFKESANSPAENARQSLLIWIMLIFKWNKTQHFKSLILGLVLLSHACRWQGHTLHLSSSISSSASKIRCFPC